MVKDNKRDTLRVKRCGRLLKLSLEGLKGVEFLERLISKGKGRWLKKHSFIWVAWSGGGQWWYLTEVQPFPNPLCILALESADEIVVGKVLGDKTYRLKASPIVQ